MDLGNFKAFYEQTSKGLWAYVYQNCRDAEASDDILQESYLRFLEKPPTSGEPAKMRAYLYTIATRLNLDRWKQAKRREKFHFFADEQNNGPVIDLAERIGLQTDVARAFDELNPKERSLLWLAYVEEHAHSTIAEIMGLKEKSVRVTLFRIRQKLKKIFEHREIFQEAL